MNFLDWLILMVLVRIRGAQVYSECDTYECYSGLDYENPPPPRRKPILRIVK